MPKQVANHGSTMTYLYAIVSGPEKMDFGPVGILGSEVYMIDDGGIAAVVSDIPKTDKLRPERRHLAAHQAVLSRITAVDNTVVLPVSFGTMAESRESIRNMLKRYHRDLQREFHRVEGKLEMELRVTLDVPNVFEYIVKKHPELREVRDRVFDGKHEPSQDEKISLGETFEQALSEDRERYTEMIEKALSKHCSEIRRNKARNEREIARLACLLGKDTKDRFESALKEASASFEDAFSFEYTGPFPPYNFIDVHLKV